MNTAEIECILRRTLEPLDVLFAGVFAADTIPNVRVFPACFVVNTDVASKPGEHWVACYAKSRGEVEFFDSYGMPVGAYPHIRLPNKVTKRNTVSLQAISSNACGHFCIYYICSRAQGTPLSSIITHLSSLNSAQRDKLVRRFVFRITSRLRITRPCRGECVGSQCCGKRVLQ
jgi:hypothetical protein